MDSDEIDSQQENGVLGQLKLNPALKCFGLSSRNIFSIQFTNDSVNLSIEEIEWKV